MIQTPEGEAVYRLRLLRKDLGVALLVVVALAAAWVLRGQVLSRTLVMQDTSSPFRLAYPATWVSARSLQDVLLKVEDPNTDSPVKTTLTVEARDLDPQSPPTMQTLLDRRTAQLSPRTAFRYLTDSETTVDGAAARSLEYAYVVQPIDTPRRASLPEVVHAREYIIATKSTVYYVTMGAPESAYEAASARFDEIIRSVKVQ